MTTGELPPDAPARELFPEYATLYDLVAAEVKGLTEEQLDFSSREAEWMWWSIRRQVSHMATVFFRWLMERWGSSSGPRAATPTTRPMKPSSFRSLFSCSVGTL